MLISFCLYEYLIPMQERQALRVYFYEAYILIHFCMEHVEIPEVPSILNTATGWKNKTTTTSVTDIFFGIKLGIFIMLG